MSLTIVKCKSCGGQIFRGWEKYSYNLKPHKAGTPFQCSRCKHTKHPTKREFDWYFCNKKCLLEFLNKTEEKEYKHDWEMKNE